MSECLLSTRQLIVNTLGINLWGDWDMGQQQPAAGEGRGRGGEARNGGQMEDKLSEMERRMGLGRESRGARW